MFSVQKTLSQKAKQCFLYTVVSHLNSLMHIDVCLQVVFSSLDLMLHTEALLSTMDFLSAALSTSSLPSPERESRKTEDMRTTSAKSSKHRQTH